MRGFSMFAALVTGLFCAQAHADTDALVSDEAAEVALAADESAALDVGEETDLAPPAEFRAPGYNIWFCSAVRRGPFGLGVQAPFHFGASNPFPQGSGQGQAARAFALRQALHSCGGSCLSDCFVKSFQL